MFRDCRGAGVNDRPSAARVLIADDDPVSPRVLRQLLGNDGYQLEFVETGDAVLRAARALRPDLLLLDVNLPGMDGFDICRTLRGEPDVAELPIIMLTALTDRAARLQGIEAGADDFISKPFDQVELAARVRAVLRLNRYRRAQEAYQLHQQMEMASAIQQQLLPRGVPGIRGLEIAARYRPAAQVGGDLYDFIVRDGRLYTVAADVSGHGVASAIFMSNARSAIRTLLDTTADIPLLAESLNARIVDDSGDSGTFISVVIASYDPGARCLGIVNCGHPEPVVVRHDNRVETVKASAAPIGLMQPLGAMLAEVRLEPGDTVCFYTDGLVEAANAGREMFGRPRLEWTLRSAAGRSLDDVADALIAEVEEFHGERGLEDDLTLVLMRQV
jgi:sigma-B regulation protein RsbU (phosphoserine phosphatase)